MKVKFEDKEFLFKEDALYEYLEEPKVGFMSGEAQVGDILCFIRSAYDRYEDTMCYWFFVHKTNRPWRYRSLHLRVDELQEDFYVNVGRYFKHVEKS